MTEIIETETAAPAQSDATRKTVKNIARFATGRVVSGVAVTLIHQNVQTHSKGQKAQLFIGAYLIGSVVADQVWKHGVEKAFDELYDGVIEARDAIREFRKTETEEKEVEETD